MARVYWDTNLFIYLFEEHPSLGPKVADIRRRMIARGDELLTSALTLGELLRYPLEAGDLAGAERFKSLFRSGAFKVLPFDRAAAEFYASIRVDRGINAVDAIHLACAASADTDLFLTNDTQLARKVVPGIQFIASLDRSPI